MAGKNLVQPCAVLHGYRSSCKVSFDRTIPAGKYYVFTLRRMDTNAKYGRFEMRLPDGRWVDAGQSGTTAFDFYDTAVGDGRANFKWDYPVMYRYPYLKAKVIEFSKETSTIELRMKIENTIHNEVAAMMLVPAGNNELLNDTIKILNGFNCNPFLIRQCNAGL